MRSGFIIFKQFSNIDDAKVYQELLAESGIETLIKDTPPGVDMTFLGSTAGHEYEIQIPESDMERASAIVSQYEEAQLTTTENVHYLYQFTDEELFEVLEKPDEWNKLDFALAKEILSDRGRAIDPGVLAAMKSERIETLSKPEKSKGYIILMGYIFALLGGLLGVVIGYSLWMSKKTLPNGESVWSYVEGDRKHGQIMFMIGIITVGLFLLLKVFGDF